MDYPVMNESQVARRWKISLKTLRRWRATGEGPCWHKLFNLVRYYVADVLEFECRGAQHWSTLLVEGEAVPAIVTQAPAQQPPAQAAEPATHLVHAKDVVQATGLPRYWLTDAMMRKKKRVPHVVLVGNVRYSLEAIWAWEKENSVVGRPAERKPAVRPVRPAPPAEPAPRWHEVARATL